MDNIFETAKQVYTYRTFTALLESLLKEGRTTGNNQSDEYLFYAKLNLQRMSRWNKTFTLRETLSQKLLVVKPQDWWVITEGWCGDSAQNLPAIARMADASGGRITLRIVLRDEQPQIMDRYLTNGTSKSIPILASFDKENNPLFRWGPRPQAAQALLTAWKTHPVPVPFETFEKEMHTWYTKDKGNALQDEFLLLLQN